MKRHLTAVFWVLYATLATGQHTQTTSSAAPVLLPGEAPTSILSLARNDDNVELLMQGFWDISFLSDGSLALSAADGAAFSAQALLFKQLPDLYVLLTLNQKWQFETRVTETVSDLLFSLGYFGDDEEIIQEARLGNSEINFPVWPGFNFSALTGAFGLKGQFSWRQQKTRLFAMLRWDTIQNHTRRFIGTTPDEAQYIEIQQWLRGKSFILPGNPPFTAVRLFLLQGGSRRELGPAEYSLSLATGSILLDKTATGQLFADYADSSMVYESVQLYDPTAYNPFELKNLYALQTDLASTTVDIISRQSGMPAELWEVEQVGPGLIQLRGALSTPADTVFSEPFYLDNAWIYQAQSTTDSDSSTYQPGPDLPGYRIRIRSAAVSSQSLAIDTAAIADTIQVYRNGISDRNFIFDTASGLIQLQPPPAPGDEILIHYSTLSTDRSDGALAVALGIEHQLSKQLLGRLAVGGRLPFPTELSESTESMQSVWANILAEIEYQNPESPLVGQAVLLGRYSQSDAAPYRRLFNLQPSAPYASVFMPLTAIDEESVLTTLADQPELRHAWADFFVKLPGSQSNEPSLQLNLAETSDTVSLVHYPESTGVETHRSLSFFLHYAPPSMVNADAMLTLRLHGAESIAELSFPLAQIPANTWLRFEIDLRTAGAELNILQPDGSTIDVPALQYSRDGLLETITMLRIDADDPGGGVLQLAAFLLGNPLNGFGLYSENSMQYTSTDEPALWFDTKINAFAENHAGSTAVAMRALFRASAPLGPLTLGLKLEPYISPDYNALSSAYTSRLSGMIHAWKGLSLNAGHDFSYDPIRSALAHTLSLQLASSGIQASAAYSGSLKQIARNDIWKFGFGSGIFNAAAGFDQSSLQQVLPAAAWGQVWLDSWRYLIPSQLLPAASRNSSLKLEAGPSTWLSVEATQQSIAEGLSGSRLSAQAKLILSAGFLDFTLQYARSHSAKLAIVSDSFYTDFKSWLNATSSLLPVWGFLPIAEFWQPQPSSQFETASTALPAAEYSPSAGLNIKRKNGFGWIDMLIPTDLSFLWSRKLERKQDIVADSSTMKIDLAGAAVNVFARQSALPVLSSIELDEYAWSFSAGLQFLEANLVLPVLTGKWSLFWHDQENGGTGLKLSSSWEQDRTESIWQHGIGWSLSKRLAASWLSGLVDLVLEKTLLRENIDAPPAETAQDPQTAYSESGEGPDELVSDWLFALRYASGVSRELWSLDLQVKRSGLDLPIVISLLENYESRYVLAGNLSAAATVQLEQQLHLYSGYQVFVFSYTLGLSLRVLF
ncbi:MAG: hypothetical protein KKI09_00035 [Spirochaetes bacterium]|nr:hypothetical protein [Spirochaetota bacterium]MBU0953785.1 hypothetical protein [Spirochaetota bacterium]